MRITSYNILDGGIGRADPLAEVILAQRPDIVALVEADDAEVVERIAARAKMDFIHAKGGKKGAALLSRWPIRETIDHTAVMLSTPSPGTPGEGRGGGSSASGRLPKSLLEATVLEPTAHEWTIGVVHLTAHADEKSERKREHEIEIVLEAFAHHRSANHPHLLMGDFNSNSPIQLIDPEKTKPETRQEWRENGGQIPRRVVQQLLDAGYVDSLYAFDPQRARTLGSFSTQFPGQRVDYIFTFGTAKIRQAWIEQDRLAKYASDHFPIGAELDL
ncbi:MAG TPA: endonuclease/exonuclease/phosphatase family protein [Tepidisphaeraceae bacterium]